MPMIDRVFESLRDVFHLYFSPRRHTALLVAIIASFAARPLIGDVGLGPTIFSITILLVLLLALYNINVDELVGERGMLLAQARRRRLIGWVLAVTAAAERLTAIVVQNRMVNLAESIGWLLFFSFVTFSELRSVLKHRDITGETISMAISVYLLLAATWGFLYLIIFQRHPGAFAGLVVANLSGTFDIRPLFPIFGYYSLGTISTIGAGDITPVSLQARYATVAEAITGQFYLAILVARLVGLQMSHSANRQAEDKTPSSNT